jgi:hypothetical protein
VVAVAIGIEEKKAVFFGSSGRESWAKFPPSGACEKYHKLPLTASGATAFATETQKTQKFPDMAAKCFSSQSNGGTGWDE